MTDHRIIHGRCQDVLPGLALLMPSSVDMVLVDLPYGTTRSKWDAVIPFDDFWPHLKALRKPGAPLVFFGQGAFLARLILSNEREFRYDRVWCKTAATGHLNAKRQPLRKHEGIAVFYDKPGTYNPQKTTGHKRKRTGSTTERDSTLWGSEGPRSAYDSTERYPTTLMVYAKDNRLRREHPTQKPVALLEDLIRTYSNPGDLVLDFTAGSGSTGVAAKQCGRRSLLIEYDAAYVDVARRRLANTHRPQ